MVPFPGLWRFAIRLEITSISFSTALEESTGCWSWVTFCSRFFLCSSPLVQDYPRHFHSPDLFLLVPFLSLEYLPEINN